MTARPVKSRNSRTPRTAPAKKSARSAAPTRRRRPDERPSQIVEAALDVFGEKGLAAARLDDIAKRAGLAKGTIYLYFPNKDELFRAVIRSTLVAELELAESLVASGTPDERFDAFLRGWWSVICSPTFERVHRLVTSEIPKFPDLARFYGVEVIARNHRLVSGIIRDGIAAGIYRESDPAATARMITGMFIIHGLWRSKRSILSHLGIPSDDMMFEQISDFLHAALRPDHKRAVHSSAHSASRSHS
jgi:AcrR family transcriptional regulator